MLISELFERLFKDFPVSVEAFVEKAPNVLDEDHARSRPPCQLNHRRKEISFVRFTELPSSYGKRRTRNTSGQQIDTTPLFLSHRKHNFTPDVSLYNWPSRAVSSKGLARVGIDLDARDVTEAGLRQAQGLTTSSGAHLKGRKIAHGSPRVGHGARDYNYRRRPI